MAPNRTTKVTLGNVRKASSISLENSMVGKSFAKRKAESSPPKGAAYKKPAFNDIENDKCKVLKTISENPNVPLTRAKLGKIQTVRPPLLTLQPNAVGVKLPGVKNVHTVKPKAVVHVKEVKEISKPVTRSSTNNLAVARTSTTQSLTSKAPTLRKPSTTIKEESKLIEIPKITKKTKSKTELVSVKPKVTAVQAIKTEKQTVKENVPQPAEKERPVTRLSARLSLRKSLSSDKSENSSLYISAVEDISNTSIKEKTAAKDERPLSEFDKELLHDPHQVSLYAMEIFEYLKTREANFTVDDYMNKQRSINANMRAVLVDWMVEVQESFELNHETLYLAVKIVDTYLSKVEIRKEKLQLVGAAALFLSCKYDERLSPLIDDFVYICDNAYSQDDLLAMEQSVLFHINFQLSFPISYSFLRRYARCARIQMPLLTLARYILELALMDYNTVTLSDSKQAAAALYLAFKMVKHDDWNEKLEYYTGYKKSDFKDIVIRFNHLLHQEPNDQLKTIKTKYSHELFFKVASTPLISDSNLDLDN